MIKTMVKDPIFLSIKSSPAFKEDYSIIQDLKDTLAFYQSECLGMAANMIGVSKNIIIVTFQNSSLILINPKIIKFSGQIYNTMEGCLSHATQREVKRYPKIKVEFEDEQFKKRIKTFEGLTAQIIQHEIDHLNGILI